jgi:hypothetical protein
MTFKVEQSGFYRTRDGRDAEVVVRKTKNAKPFDIVATGFIGEDNSNSYLWQLDGRYYNYNEDEVDLIKYLGKERPKQKKVVRMAPVLCFNHQDYWLSDEFYESEMTARINQAFFVRWLIDTPYEISVEVPDNA